MDIDNILSQFGEKSKAPVSDSSGAFNADEILSQFGTSEPKTIPKDVKRVIINTNPKPPISGISKEASDELNQTRIERFGGENPRNRLPTTNIGEKAYEADNAGKEMFSSGVDDFSSGHPYKGIAKIAGGALSRAYSPISGLVEGGISDPITDITGNQNIGDRAGLVISSAMPLGSTGKAVIAAKPANKALKNLIENIGPDNLPSVVSAMKANPRLAPADLSPRVLQDTQHLFANEGPQIDYLANASSARLAGTKNATVGAFDTSMGATVNAAQKVDDLKKAAQEIGKKNIEPVLTAKPHTDITDLVKHIDSEIGYPAMKAIKEGSQPPLPLSPYQTELLNVRNKLRNPAWPDRDHMFAYTDQIHDAQIALREKAQGLTSSSTGSERNTGKELLIFREKMKDAVGTDYKEALAKYAGQKKIEEAFHNGYDTILNNSKKLENDPSFFEKWVNSSTRKPGELEAAKEGARLRIQHEIDAARTTATNPASKAIGIGQTEFSVKRIEALLGKEETDKFLRTLDDERKIANTHNKIIEGSQTAMRTASKSQFALPDKTEVMKSAPMLMAAEGANFFYGGYPGAATGAAIVAKTLAAAKDVIKMKLAREHNLQYAKYALPTEGPSRDALIQSLQVAIPSSKLSLLNKAKASLPATYP